MTNRMTTTTADLRIVERDRAEIEDILTQTIAAWNRSDGDQFAAPFTDTADFVAFEGTHLKGRDEIAAFHREIFATAVQGTRLDGGVRFVRLLTPDVAVMHSWVTYVNLPGKEEPTRGRLSMQLYVITRTDGGWRGEAMLNARQLTLDQQQRLDDIEASGA
jgi:uncharacterized protein (TIGR02246 family)